MDKYTILKLNDSDPEVVAAREAEQRLFAFYGLQPKTHYVELPGMGIRIRVSEIGSGPPVVIMPGNTGDVFPLIPLLAQLKGRRIIAVNRAGGGLSEGIDHREVDVRQLAVQTLVAVLDFFAMQSVPVIAHSIGGHFSLWAAMDQPDRVSALILLGVPGNIINTGPPFMLRLLGVPVINRLLLALINPHTPRQSLKALGIMGHLQAVIDALPDAMADCYFYFRILPHYKISALSLMEQHTQRITAEQLKTVQQPVMFLWGTNDPFGSIEKGKHIASLVTNAEFHAITNAGHLPWLDNPVECGALSMIFLAAH